MSSTWADTVRVGDRLIGAAAPVFVVAEAGVNHGGDVGTAIRMVRAAADAGADAVKFQAFDAEALVTAAAPAAQYQKSAATQRELLTRLELSPLELAQAKAECEALGLVFLATPFTPRDVANLMGLGVAALKIASPDLANLPLLRVAAATRLPVILSTGASTIDEVERATGVLRDGGCRELVLLHCVSAYPTPPAQANLRTIGTLGRFGAPVGYSDHTAEVETGGLAVAAGAVLLEKHFTLGRRRRGPDHFFSLEPDELADYVAAARRAETVLGHGRREVANGERDVRTVARSSVVSACPIAAGAAVERAMLTVKRPGGGIEPGRLDELVGRRAAADIPADTTLDWKMFGASDAHE